MSTVTPSASSTSGFKWFQWDPAPALRESLRQGYRLADFRSDLMAAIIVGTVALPLSMALAIATGVKPENGLYTAIFAGAVIALLGGSRVQVSGPTAAFVVILAPIAERHGLAGLMVASLLAGCILVFMGGAGLGRLIHYIPYPVTTGFTAGIAVVIATLQVKDFLGLSVTKLPEHFHDKLVALAAAVPTARAADAAIGAGTLAMLLFLPRLTRRIPAPIVALPLAALAAYVVERQWPGAGVATISSAFGGIPRALPAPVIPWQMPVADGAIPDVGALMGPAFAIAMLGAIESLLSAVIADGMTGHKHDPDGELVAQGIGNIVAPFFGGFAATGAIARTATNIRSGGRTPIAGFLHAIFVLAAMLLFAPWLGYLPMAALAALLLIVAWNMSEARHALRMLRIAPRSDSFVLVACFLLTVLFDMVIAVTVGMVLAALLFMKRMAELTTFKLAEGLIEGPGGKLPPGVLVYEIAGPLFFGATQKAVSALRSIGNGVKVVLLDMRAVPTMDATGLVNLESALDTLHKSRIHVVVAGVQDQPLHLMARAGWKHRPWVTVLRSFEEGMAAAKHAATTEDIHTVAAAKSGVISLH